MGRDRYPLEGKVVLLTGGARGIGADAARRLADRGAKLALVDRDAEVERRAAELGGGAVAFVADVTDPAALEVAIAGTVEHFGGIDVAIANAGILGPAASIAAIEPREFERVIEVNLLGVWRTVRASLPHVVERRGYILAIASVAAALPLPLLTAYGTSKAAVEAFCRGLRMELAATGTRVGVGYFGVIQTDLVDEAMSQPAIAQLNRMIPGSVGGPAPVGRAGAAIVRGIERRAKRVYSPFWVPALLAARGLQGPFEESVARRRWFLEACRAAEETASDPGLRKAS